MQGGVADYTRELGRALVELGHDVGVLTAVDATKGWVEPGIEVFPRIDSWGWNVWSELDKVVDDWQPDVVHIQYQTAAYDMHPAVNLWSRRPGKRKRQLSPVTAVTFHDLLVPFLFPKAHWLGLRRRVTHTLATNVDLAITTNPEDTLALQPVRSDLVEIPIGSNIPCAPPPAFVRYATSQALGIPADAPLLCYFGFLNASKGGEMLVDVLANLVEQGYDGHPSDVHLLMIGGRVGASDPTNYAYLQQVEARIEQLGLTPRLHWTGHVPAPDVSAAFLSSDLCLLPYQDGASYRRGSFMAALEHGMPIVTTTPSVPYPDLVDGETLLLAPPDDAEALTTACARILSDSELRSRLGKNARALSQQFSWQSIAKRHLDSYELLATIPGK